MQTLSTLQQYAQTGLTFSELSEGYLVAEIDNAHAKARIAVQGANVLDYQPKGQEPVIWLSPVASFKVGKSVRGGVPVCWPWFGAHEVDSSKPGHGYARVTPWTLQTVENLDSGALRLRWQLEESNATRTLWDLDTPVTLDITIGANLQLILTTRNLNDSPVIVSEALHTYFTISDVDKVQVHGLDGCEYYDKVEGMQRKTQTGAVTISSEVDRVYVNTDTECVIEDQGLQRRIHINKQNSQSTVVWNPWVDKANKMGDLGDDGYRRMLCVESGNALENEVIIPALGEHYFAVEYRVAAM